MKYLYDTFTKTHKYEQTIKRQELNVVHNTLLNVGYKLGYSTKDDSRRLYIKLSDHATIKII